MSTCSLRSYSVTEISQVRNQDRSLEEGTETESIEKGCFLTCSPWLSKSAFIHNSGHHP